uniref:Uncharacterized protein n=1 Tax=Avena sativa TaxID=4498 RepID=A0ACD5Y489_AVESA
MPPLLSLPLLVLLLLSPSLHAADDICIVGSGISGASTAFFLTNYTSALPHELRVFERRNKVGGRLATVTVSGDEFEAGGSIIHPRNLHVRRFAALLGLAARADGDDDDWLGIWDGGRFVFKTLCPPPPGSSWLRRRLHGVANSLLLLWRYGLSLFRMDSFVQEMLQKFLRYYNGFESRPVFDNVEEMLKWSGLYGLTQRTLEELIDAGMNSQTISELVTVITRINYGQSVSMSGLAGAVSLAGSESGLWAIKGGNWQLAAGLLKTANANLHLQEGIDSIFDAGDYYVLKSNKGQEYNCKVTVIATPLDEVNITFVPPISVPPRKMQHTHTTFVRGLLNPKFFGLSSVSDIPKLIGTMELPDVPFSCISVLKKHSEHDMTYKMFSRTKLGETLLDQIFSTREETVRIDWPAYPHYHAPEDFAPIILDGKHLYYVNSFESAASAMETGAVAAENIARLIISRLPLGLRARLSSPSSEKGPPEPHMESFIGEEDSRRVDL